MENRFDVQRVREQFPALERTFHGRRVVYFDGPGGSQVAKSAIDAMADYMSRGGANLHGVFPTSEETEQLIADTRAHAAALLGAHSEEVAFGANMTTLNFAIARAISRTWEPGDEVVVTELDHRANVDPWLTAARDRGVTVNWLRVDTDSVTLRLDALDAIIIPRTKLVALGLSSNAVGTVTDVRKVADAAHRVGALVVVDAVHGAPHVSIDRDALGADILLCSAYKFFGPHVGIAAIRRDLFAPLDVYKLQPAPAYIPDKLETGTQNHEALAGVRAAIQLIASLGQGASLRARLVDAMQTVEAYEDDLAQRLRAGVRTLPGVTLYAAPDSHRKTPTVAFRVDGRDPREICTRLLEDRAVFVADGDFYATTLAEQLGILTSGGWVRAGLAPYNTMEEVESFLEALARILGR